LMGQEINCMDGSLLTGRSMNMLNMCKIWTMRTSLISFVLMILLSSCKENDHTGNDVIFKFDLYDDLTNEDVALIQNKLNGNFGRIISDLKVLFSGTFTIHIWENEENYLTAQEKYIGMKYPGSSGYVLGPNEIALLYCSSVDENAEHEFAHCISLHVQANFSNHPRWLWEAVAIYESGEYTDPQNISYLMSGNFPTLNELNGDFNNGNQKIYEVGYLLTEFILHEWGKDKLINLIKNLGDVERVLDISVAEFENKWKAFVVEKYFKSPNGPGPLN
jgi:hypothetical protein